MERRFEFGGGGGLLVSGWVTLNSNHGRIFMVEDIPVGKLELGNITNDWHNGILNAFELVSSTSRIGSAKRNS
jgi:hypothetical protein